MPAAGAPGAGDVNGDGYADVVAAISGTFGISVNSVRVYAGSQQGLAAAALTILEFPLDNSYGLLAGSAGDVNADGYGDIIVAGTLSGSNEVRIHPGSPSGLAQTSSWSVSKSTDSTFGSAGGGMRSEGRVSVYLGGADGLATTPVAVLVGVGIHRVFVVAPRRIGDDRGSRLLCARLTQR
jgi:hypothetical protein